MKTEPGDRPRALECFGLGVAAALLAMGCVAPEPPGEDEAIGETAQALQTTPSLGGPYASNTTYRCTSIPTSYCYDSTNFAVTTQAQIDTYVNNARLNWGCGNPSVPRGYITGGRWAGSQYQWYYGGAGYSDGCLVYWNVEKQAAYVMLNDPTSASNGGTSPQMYSKFASMGWENGALGLPISNPIPYGWAGVTAQWFAGGLMTQHGTFGAHYALNDLVDDYREYMGYSSPTAFGNHFYAFTGDQQPTIDGAGDPTGQAVAFFDAWWGYRGYVTRRTGDDEAFTVFAPMARAWDAAGGRDGDGGGWQELSDLPLTRGPLGFPTSNLEAYSREVTSGTELQKQSFDGGVIYWKPTDSYLNGTRPRPHQNCDAGGYDNGTNGCIHLNGIHDVSKCTSSQPACASPTTIYGTRYSHYRSELYVTANLPLCSSLSLDDAVGYWRPCRDGEGRLSNLGASPSYVTASQTSCQHLCPSVADGGLGGNWDSPCFNVNGEYSQCGEYGEYGNSCTSVCLGKLGGLYAVLGGPGEYGTPCTRRDGVSTTCGAMGYAVHSAIDPDPPPPECSAVCSPVVACSGMTCGSGGVTTTCKEYGALPCGSSADFLQTASGPRFRFTLSSPLVTGPGCGGDSDGDCLDNTMEDQLAMAAAPRLFYDEDESCGGGPGLGGYDYFDSGALMSQHCNRVDLFQVRPFGDAEALPYYASGNEAGPVSSWTRDDKVKTVVIRYFMAYPYQIVSFAGTWLASASHVGDLEWMEVGLQSSDLRTWVVTNVWLSHHGPVNRGDHYGSSGKWTSYAEHMARMARDGTPNHDAILNIAADEDSHGSWAGRASGRDDCDGAHSNTALGVRDCFWGASFRSNVIAGKFSSFDASRNIGGTHAPEYLRVGGFAGDAQLMMFPHWQGPGGTGEQFLYTLAYDSGHGVVHESLVDSDNTVAGGDAPAHERFAGWKCPVRNVDGDCYQPPHHSDVTAADGACYLFDVAPSMWGSDSVSKGVAFSAANEEGYCYTLWGAQSRRPFTK